MKKKYLETAVVIVNNDIYLKEFFKIFYKYNLKNIIFIINNEKNIFDLNLNKPFNFNLKFFKKKNTENTFQVLKKYKKKLPNFFLLVNSSAFLNENLFNLFFKFYKNFYKNLIVKKKVNDRIINTEFSIINKNNLYDYSLVDNKKYFKNKYRSILSDKEFIQLDHNKKIKNKINSFFFKIYSKNILLDRDGVINVDKGYVGLKKNFVWQKGALKAIKYLNKKNYNIFVITNQSGIARGYFSEEAVINLHAYIKEQLQRRKCYINKIYYSPFHIDGIIPKYSYSSNCRKPGDGLFKILTQEWNILFNRNIYMIGDQKSDIEFAKNCRIKGLLFKSGRLDIFLKKNNI